MADKEDIFSAQRMHAICARIFQQILFPQRRTAVPGNTLFPPPAFSRRIDLEARNIEYEVLKESPCSVLANAGVKRSLRCWGVLARVRRTMRAIAVVPRRRCGLF